MKMDRFMDILTDFLLDDNDINVNIIQNTVRELAEPIHEGNLYNRRRALVKRRNKYYFERTIPKFNDIQFQEMFRMNRITFERLLNRIGENIDMRKANDYAPLDKKVLFTIWILSRPVTFLSAGDRFNIPTSSGHGIFKHIIQVLVGLLPFFIKFPNNTEKRKSNEVFELRSGGFRGVIGAIDGCHVPIKQPKGNSHDFYNRKGFHSIILQGVCNHDRQFIDCFIGMPGRMHDARVFKNSPIYHNIIDKNYPLLKHDEHLIGDSAYPLMLNLLVPYKDNGHLTEEQIKYNVKLSSIRSVVERAFGLLKGKFRRLKYLDISDLNLAKNIIGASCVLHNFILTHMDEIDDVVEEPENNTEDVEYMNINIERPTNIAIEKRENIMRHL